MFSNISNVLYGLAEVPAGDPTQAGGIIQMLGGLLPLLAIFVLMYFMMIRPQKKKDKKVKDMLNALKVGDRVTTIGGIYGTIDSIKDDKMLTLAVGHDKTKIVFARWAIRDVDEMTIANDGETLA